MGRHFPCKLCKRRDALLDEESGLHSNKLRGRKWLRENQGSAEQEYQDWYDQEGFCPDYQLRHPCPRLLHLWVTRRKLEDNTRDYGFNPRDKAAEHYFLHPGYLPRHSPV